jgi:hypothetical protein
LKHFAIGGLGARGALDANRVAGIGNVSPFRMRLCDEAPFELIVRLHRNVDVRVGGLARHLARILRQGWSWRVADGFVVRVILTRPQTDAKKNRVH